MRTSLKDIARETGVSVSLVSKVLNNRMGTTNVSPEVAQRIHDNAKKFSYQKNTSALAFRQGRHDVIGVMVHRLGAVGSNLTEKLLMGIAEVAKSHQQKLMLNFVTNDEEFLAGLRMAHGGMMDGMIIGGVTHPKLTKAIDDVFQEKFPIVTIYDAPALPHIPNVGLNHTEVGYIATQHLLNLGCKKIAHIHMHEPRLKGYSQALEEAGHPRSLDLVYDAGPLEFTYEAGVAAVKHFIKHKIEFDALVAESDQQAAGAINELQRVGVKTPKEIKVIGVDNAPFCHFISPSITSISLKARQRGELAVAMYLKAQQGETVKSVSLSPELIIRQSTVEK